VARSVVGGGLDLGRVGAAFAGPKYEGALGRRRGSEFDGSGEIVVFPISTPVVGDEARVFERREVMDRRLAVHPDEVGEFGDVSRFAREFPEYLDAGLAPQQVDERHDIAGTTARTKSHPAVAGVVFGVVSLEWGLVVESPRRTRGRRRSKSRSQFRPRI